eukprot:TRINITY_DN358_c0_g1_i1.p1 TRINITY_DN358_c0_g1~~TRINITY_DN358_c0_g1_i1.p1  ORF type:complete len:807 (+),score=211.15 TRINITY_DN358_c0_g1_i1:53-2473(+)
MNSVDDDDTQIVIGVQTPVESWNQDQIDKNNNDISFISESLLGTPSSTSNYEGIQVGDYISLREFIESKGLNPCPSKKLDNEWFKYVIYLLELINGTNFPQSIGITSGHSISHFSNMSQLLQQDISNIRYEETVKELDTMKSTQTGYLDEINRLQILLDEERKANFRTMEENKHLVEQNKKMLLKLSKESGKLNNESESYKRSIEKYKQRELVFVAQLHEANNQNTKLLNLLSTGRDYVGDMEQNGGIKEEEITVDKNNKLIEKDILLDKIKNLEIQLKQANDREEEKQKQNEVLDEECRKNQTVVEKLSNELNQVKCEVPNRSFSAELNIANNTIIKLKQENNELQKRLFSIENWNSESEVELNSGSKSQLKDLSWKRTHDYEVVMQDEDRWTRQRHDEKQTSKRENEKENEMRKPFRTRQNCAWDVSKGTNQRGKQSTHVSQQAHHSQKQKYGNQTTRDVMRRDRIIHHLGLEDIYDVPNQQCKDILIDCCSMLQINNINLLTSSVQELIDAIDTLSSLNEWSKKVCEILLEDSDKNIDDFEPTDVLEELKDWKRLIREKRIVDNELEEISGLLHRRTVHNKTNYTSMPYSLIYTSIESLIDIEKRYIVLKKGLSDETLSVIEKVDLSEIHDIVPEAFVKHFMHLFDVKHVEGIFTRMNELYRVIEEQRNIMQAISTVLDVPSNLPLNRLAIYLQEHLQLKEQEIEKEMKENSLLMETARLQQENEKLKYFGVVFTSLQRLLQLSSINELPTKVEKLRNDLENVKKESRNWFAILEQLKSIVLVDSYGEIVPKVFKLTRNLVLS